MKTFWLLLAVAVIGLPGCVSKKTARLEAQSAFLAGREQAASAPPVVLITGDVKNNVVPWHEGMTLAEALLAAEYRGLWDPKTIIINRPGQTLTVNVRNLLHGRDNPPLLPGDRLEVQR